jgi:REP element-mobilizing transposase RayT
MNRGAGGTVLFSAPSDTAAFVTRLGEIACSHPVEIHAYCVMGKHYHLLARAEEALLLHAVSVLEATVPNAMERPRLRRLALGRHLLQVTRYIHRNPVEAGLVRRPADWPWSSYRGYLDGGEAPRWLRTQAVLGWLGSFGPRQRYRELCEGEVGPGVVKMDGRRVSGGFRNRHPMHDRGPFEREAGIRGRLEP